MVDEPVSTDTSLKLQAMELLLVEQRFRIARYVAAHALTASGAGTVPRPPAPAPAIPPPLQKLLDSLEIPVTIVRPVTGERGGIRYLYVGQNVASREYAAHRFPPGVVPPWTGPVPLFERFPTLADTPVPHMLAEAHRTGRPQGPEVGEWPLPGPGGLVVRVSSELRVIPCEGLLLIGWERGRESRTAQEAQRLVGVCWAEWNLGDGSVEGSSGLRGVLGLTDTQPLPDLLELSRTVTPESLDALYRSVHDLLLCSEIAECDLHLTAPDRRILRFVGEPVRLAAGPVWALRAVLQDVTEDRRSRALAERATREAQAQRERADTVAEVAERLRDAVLPRFPGELAEHGIEAAAVYRPEEHTARVGGDWYKTRVLPSGRVLIALGDARGHGLDAVTLMAKLRYALTGLAYTGEWVERLTAWLNTVACDDGEESTATAIIARYHPETGLLRWTCAGHPLPILVREKRAFLLGPPPGGPGMPLGVMPDETYAAAETWLRPQDVVLLYSDGLVERRDSDPDLDTARLLRAVEQCAARGVPPGEEALGAFVRELVALLTGRHTQDDATVLALRLKPGASATR
jgi:serine phosphatase RsbU (regulator of sigma subunit)